MALKEGLARRRYPFKPGELDHELCPDCGVPREVSHLDWDLELGIITDPASAQVEGDLRAPCGGRRAPRPGGGAGGGGAAGRRGGQRRYVKFRVGEENCWKRGSDFMCMGALRGLGYVARFEANTERLSVTLRNACMPCPNVGMA